MDLRNNNGQRARQAGEELQQVADDAAAAQAQRDREDRIRAEARREREALREAAAQERREREDEIRAERSRQELQRAGEDLMDRALCMQDPNCRSIYQY